MAIKVSKPSINLREKLSELDFDKVPFQKMPAGSTLQVVSATQASQLDLTTLTTWTDTGLSLTIHPTATNSKMLISICMPFRLIAATGYMRGALRVMRDSTVIYNTQSYGETYQVRDANNEWNDVANIIDLDAPSTTSPVTYTVQARIQQGDVFRIYNDAYGSRMIAQEIAQ
jgi:hypothetical protein